MPTLSLIRVRVKEEVQEEEAGCPAGGFANPKTESRKNKRTWIRVTAVKEEDEPEDDDQGQEHEGTTGTTGFNNSRSASESDKRTRRSDSPNSSSDQSPKDNENESFSSSSERERELNWLAENIAWSPNPNDLLIYPKSAKSKNKRGAVAMAVALDTTSCSSFDTGRSGPRGAYICRYCGKTKKGHQCSVSGGKMTRDIGTNTDPDPSAKISMSSGYKTITVTTGMA